MSFDKKFFSENRKNLAKLLPGYELFLSANALVQESADLAFPFRQDSSFWYLTGIDEPEVLLVLDCDSGETTLFLPEQNDYQKDWDGSLSGKDIEKTSGIKKVENSNNLNVYLDKALKDKKKFGYLAPPPSRVEPYGFYANPARRKLEQKILRTSKKIKKSDLVDIRRELASLRQVKQQQEVAAIKKAIAITARGLERCRSTLNFFETEKDIERAITAEFYANGADGHAYKPIIASGKNAAIIHYNSNNQPIEQNSLLLLDVGAKVHGYAADISRTWGIGSTSVRQQDLYKMVLELQNYCLSELKAGVILREYHEKIELKAKELYRANGVEIERFPHAFSHHLGLDVHDIGLYDEPLPEHAVVTVEPGIYVPEEGIGIRIEDDVLITKKGIINMSEDIPKI